MQGDALDMLQDVNTGIAWVLRHAPAFGGDGASFHLVGQSAGGQLAAMALLLQVAARSQAGGVVGASPAWDPSLISGFVGVRWGARAGSKDCGVHGGAQGAGGAPLACRARRCWPCWRCSGTYNLYALADHLHRRGLYRNLFEAIHSLDGKPKLRELSPTFQIRCGGLCVCVCVCCMCVWLLGCMWWVVVVPGGGGGAGGGAAEGREEARRRMLLLGRPGAAGRVAAGGRLPLRRPA